jgi:hypothetical protein
MGSICCSTGDTLLGLIGWVVLRAHTAMFLRSCPVSSIGKVGERPLCRGVWTTCSFLAAFRLSNTPTPVGGALNKDRHRSSAIYSVLRDHAGSG